MYQHRHGRPRRSCEGPWTQVNYRPSVQAKPVARAAFFATRLSPAPVFRAALFADLIAFVVLDVLRLAFFMIPPVSRFRPDSFHAPPVILRLSCKKTFSPPSMDAKRAFTARSRPARSRASRSTPIHPSSGRKDKLMRVTTASQERFSSWGYTRSKQ